MEKSMIHQEAHMNAQFDNPLDLTNNRRTIAAGGPIVGWQPDEVSAEIQNVRVKTPPGQIASSLLSVTVFPADNHWALELNSPDPLPGGQADAYAYVIVTRADGTHYHPPCYNDVRLHP
jgi:hypothetical protein